GWSLFSAATLPILRLAGFSALAVIALAALGLVLAGIGLSRSSALSGPPADLKPWWLAAASTAAAILALAPALALLPKISPTGVHLATPIFDHSKIPIIDAMTRQSLPPVNPVSHSLSAATASPAPP